MHVAGAMALVVTAVMLAGRAQPVAVLRAGSRRLLALLAAQIVLGVAVFLHRTYAYAMLRTSHVALGALVLAQAVVLVWESVACASVRTCAARS